MQAAARPGTFCVFHKSLAMGALFSQEEEPPAGSPGRGGPGPRPVSRMVRGARPSTYVPEESTRVKNPCVHVPIPTQRSSIIYWMIQAKVQEVPKSEWGHVVWDHLHLRSMCWKEKAYDFEIHEELLYLQAVFANLPCEECRKHATEHFRTYPPALKTREAYIAWVYDFHNTVNLRLSREGDPTKAYFTWEEFTARYQLPLIQEHVC
jgi:hypothetical protein